MKQNWDYWVVQRSDVNTLQFESLDEDLTNINVDAFFASVEDFMTLSDNIEDHSWSGDMEDSESDSSSEGSEQVSSIDYHCATMSVGTLPLRAEDPESNNNRCTICGENRQNCTA